ncbi:MAG: hypothetical protein AAF802_28315 [Planctomycetota bacterium]
MLRTCTLLAFIFSTTLVVAEESGQDTKPIDMRRVDIPIHESLSISHEYISASIDALEAIDSPAYRGVKEKLEGVKAFRKTEFAEATQHFERAVELLDSDAESVWMLVRSLANAGEVDEALRVCTDGIVQHPDFYPLRVTHFVLLKNPESSRTEVPEGRINEIATDEVMFKDSSYIHYMRAVFAFQKGEFSEASDHFSKSLAGTSTYFQVEAHNVLMQRGHAELKQGHFHTGYADVRRSVASMKESQLSEDAMVLLCVLAQKSGRPNIAYVEAKRAEQLFPESIRVKEVLLLAMALTNRASKASELVNDILATNPNNRLARKIKERIAAASRASKNTL